jgi:hypothetical protein
MNAEKKYRALLRKQANHVAFSALRGYFFGGGATSRWFLFIRRGTVASMKWMLGIFVFLASLFAISVFFFFTKDLHDWMISTPIDQVLIQSHCIFMVIIGICVKTAFIMGFIQKFLEVAQL